MFFHWMLMHCHAYTNSHHNASFQKTYNSRSKKDATVIVVHYTEYVLCVAHAFVHNPLSGRR